LLKRCDAPERDGLISLQLDPGRIDTATLYQLTDIGRTIDGPLAVLTNWADGNWNFVAAARSWDIRTQNGEPSASSALT
jgi:DNA-binding HxlR family transcriptional regulator